MRTFPPSPLRNALLTAVAAVAAVLLGQNPAGAGLVAHWPLDGDARDAVGAHHGNIGGGVVFGAEGAAAHTGTAAEFNGSSATITVPHSPALNPASFTLCLWASADSTSGYASAVTSRDDDGSSVSGYILYNDSAGRWNFWTGGGGAPGTWPQLPGPPVQVGSWTHLALQYDAASQTMRLYVNGALANSAAGAGLYAPNGPQSEDLHIGSGADNGGSFYFDGLIDDVALWDEALSAAEIQGVMNDGVPGGPPTIDTFAATPPFIDSGQSATLAWRVAGAETVGIEPGVGDVDPDSGSAAVSPAATTTYTLTATAEGGAQSTAQVTVGVDVEALPPRLNEFLADNEAGLADAEGDREDWIEIHNPNPFTIDLAGWSLTDDPARPDKWVFPAASSSIAAGGYLVVFASEKDLPGHSNFRLERGGEYLALFDPQGEAATEFAPAYPPQFDDIAFGTPAGGGGPAPMRPTPGAANGNALLEVAPAITGVTEDPAPPDGATALVIEATATPRAGAVADVTLHYRVNYGAVQSLAMTAAGGDLYTAAIPASAYGAGDMLRWFVTAATAGGESSREPPFPDPTESAEYFGTVVAGADGGTALPVLHWFTADTAGADTRGGARASLFFKGRFYDNLFCRIRGQSTANWPKHKYKFDFYRGGHFFWKDGAPEVEEFNVNSHYRDGYVRENAIFAFLKLAGSPAPETMPMWIRRNNADFGLFTFVEQVDEEFLGRHGFDASGAMYKAINVPATLSPTVNSSLYRKVLQRNTPYTDLAELTAGINIANPDRFAYVADEVNLPNYINVMAAMAVPFNHDQLTKNYYLYRDPGRGEWFRFPWDGDQGLPTGTKNTHENWASPLYGDAQHTQELVGGNPNPTWQNHLHAAVLDNPVTREMYLRRLRTLADRHLAVPAAGAETTLLPEAAAARYLVPADASLGQGWTAPAFDDSGWAAGTYGIGYENAPGDYVDHLATRVRPVELVPGATSIYLRSEFEIADPAAVSNPVLGVRYDDGFVAYLNGVEVARANVAGAPAHDSTAASHADSLAVGFEEFPLPGAALVVGTNVLAIHAVNQSAGSSDMLIEPRLVDRPGASGSTLDALVMALADRVADDVPADDALWSGITSFSGTVNGILNSSLPNRRTALYDTYGPPGSGLVPEAEPANPVIGFGQIEFNPAGGDQDAEFIELVNPNPFAVDLSGWRLEGGVEFTFPPGAVIPAAGADPERGKVFLSPDVAAFRARAASPTGGEGRLVLGNYSGHLSNFGETLILSDAGGRAVATTSTPAEPGDAQRFLVVSEIMYHPADGAGGEFIELMNISDTVTLDLAGVAFTGGVDFTFPAGATLAPGARVVIDGAQFAGGTALSNGGERLKLDDATGSTVRDFRYDDAPPWPTAADGAGRSLVLVRPETAPDHGDPASWRPSALLGGNPGSGDHLPFGGGDLLGYALAEPGLDVGLAPAGTTFSYTLRLGADDAEVIPEWSANLVDWDSAPLVFGDRQTAAVGPTETLRWELPGGGRGFVRLRVEAR